MPEILLTRCNCVTFLAGRPFWRAECVLMLQAALARSGEGSTFGDTETLYSIVAAGRGGAAADSDGTRTSVSGRVSFARPRLARARSSVGSVRRRQVQNTFEIRSRRQMCRRRRQRRVLTDDDHGT